MTHRPIATILAELEERDLLVDFTAIAKRHGVTLRDVLGDRRYAVFAAARHECMALLQERGWSLTRIGDLFGKDHTTVRMGCRSHERRLAKAMMREIRGAA